MGSRSLSENRLILIRAALLLAGLSTYFISPDDVVWRFIRHAPHARLLEHILFAAAAAVLGLALLVKMSISTRAANDDVQNLRRKAAVASLLQAIGIGSLLPLPGFLLLVLGDVGVSLFWEPAGKPLHAYEWVDALIAHIGLCFAFLSMVIFSLVLIDRVADVLFAMTALISIVASFRSGSERS